MSNNEFSQKLLESKNPFPSPEPPRRPSFVIGGDPYLKWFMDTYNSRTRQEGTSGVFIVGMPGSGKTHFLRHLDYLFYEKNTFKGIYAISTLSDQDIDEKEIWKELFLKPDSANRLVSTVPKENILNTQIRPDIKVNLQRLLDQNLDIDSLSVEAIRRMAEHISNLLPDESIICFALDNIEEYLSARENEYLIRAQKIPEEITSKQKATAAAVKLLVEKIRNMTSGLRTAIVLLALTTPAWAEVKKTEPARTKARRFKFAEEEQVLTELTLPQCYELVHEYMKRWSDENGVTLPTDHEECMCNVGSEVVSIFPFTPLAIELARKVTDQLAGDITCFCSECVSRMVNNGRIEVVKESITMDNLLRISKEYPWFGWADRARETLAEMGPIILEKHLADKLADLEKRKRNKYRPGLETETIASSLDRFAEILGILVSPSPTVENSYNPSAKPIQPSPLLKIWSLADKKIAVKYVIGKESRHIPSAHMYGGEVNFQDFVDVLSIIDAEKATHGLLVLVWAERGLASFELGSGLRRALKELGNTLMTIDVSDDIYKIIGASEATEEQKHLARYVDKIFANLTERLTLLIQQERPVEEYRPEKYTRAPG